MNFSNELYKFKDQETLKKYLASDQTYSNHTTLPLFLNARTKYAHYHNLLNNNNKPTVLLH